MAMRGREVFRGEASAAKITASLRRTERLYALRHVTAPDSDWIQLVEPSDCNSKICSGKFNAVLMNNSF